METGTLFSLANFLYLIGTILLTRRLINNRDALKDFDFYGSLINMSGMLVAAAALITMESYMAMIISIPTLIFWTMASMYSFKNRKMKNEKEMSKV